MCRVFRDRLEAGPTPEDGVCTFRCQDLGHILEEEFGVSSRRQAIYDLLHRLDYSSLMPRPQHEQANPEVQEFFKEIVVEQIDAIAAIPRSRFIPISRMKPASARRGRSHGSGRGGVRDRVRCGRRDSARSTCWRPFSAATGAMSAVIMPTLNTEVVNLFLEQLACELPAGVVRPADLGLLRVYL